MRSIHTGCSATIDSATVIHVDAAYLYVGKFLTDRIRVLHEHNIPSAVIGGLFCNVLVAALYALANVRVEFAVDLRDLLLVVFFSTVGLSANPTLLGDSGKAVFVLLVLATAVLIFQVPRSGHSSGWSLKRWLASRFMAVVELEWPQRQL